MSSDRSRVTINVDETDQAALDAICERQREQGLYPRLVEQSDIHSSFYAVDFFPLDVVASGLGIGIEVRYSSLKFQYGVLTVEYVAEYGTDVNE